VDFGKYGDDMRTIDEIKKAMNDNGVSYLTADESSAYSSSEKSLPVEKMIAAFYTESVQCGDKTITKTASLTFPETIDAQSVIRALKAEVQSNEPHPII